MSSWWSKDRIAATVTESYIVQRLGQKKERVLHSPLAFGAGLTDDTYLEWILQRSPRLFLILDDITAADHIFTAVDRSFDDDDLALNDQAISELGLSGAVAKRFKKRQYAFLVQELSEGSHVDYGEDHVIPVHPLPRKQGYHQISANVDRVQIGDKTYLRRRISLDEDSGIEKIHFILHFKSLQKLKHPHLTAVWATYTYKEEGYVLMQPAFDTTLKSFLDEPPKHFKNLTKSEQRDILIRWTQCLTSALAYLHDNGYAHQAIRPSNIYLDNHYNIFLGDYGALGALEDKEPAYAKDAYNHGAPEQWQRKATFAETCPLRSTLQSGGRTGRRIRATSTSALTARPDQSPDRARRTLSRGSNHIDMESNVAGARTSTLSSGSTAPTMYTSSTTSSEGRSRVARAQAVVTTLTYSKPNQTQTMFDASPFFPSDVFSICCVITSLLSLLSSLSTSSSKLAPSNIPAHLGKRNRTAGRGGKGGAPADVSWHSNLGQVSTWLDLLDETAAEKPAKKISIGRKKPSEKDADSESWRWKGLLKTITNLMRYGFQKDTTVRWTAASGVSQISKALKKWRIEPATCCEGVRSTPASLTPTSEMPPAVATPPSSGRSTKRSSTRSRRSTELLKIKSRSPTTPSIPEETYTMRSPLTPSSPRRVELPAEDVVAPLSPVSPLTPHGGYRYKYKYRYDGPAIAELPASEYDVYSPQRERFLPPPRETWDFDFQFQAPEEDIDLEDDEDDDDDDDESYFDESIVDDEDLMGIENWPAPLAFRQRDHHDEHRRVPSLRGGPPKVMDRPRPPTSGMVAVPVRGAQRMGTAA